MKTFGLLALGGAMGLKFEDLSYNNLRDAFSKVRQFLWLDPFTSKFRQFPVFMATEILIPRLSVTTTFHISNGAMPMEMDQLPFLNPPDVDQNQDSGTQLK